MLFNVWEKWYVQSEVTEVCEFRAKIPAFYRRLQLAAPVLPRHHWEKFFSTIISCKKWKTFPTLEWNSFVYFSVYEENCREPAEQHWKGKNGTRRKQVVLFIGPTLSSILAYLSLYSNRPFYLNSFIFNCSFRTKVNITCKFLDYLISFFNYFLAPL